MNIYILAEFPFALKRDGKELAKNAKYCELSADGNSVLEIMPLDLSPARCFSPSEAFFRAADENAALRTALSKKAGGRARYRLCGRCL